MKEICERLSESGLDVEILTTDPSGNLPREEKINDVSVKRFKSWAPGEAYYFSNQLLRYLRNPAYKYDIVHAHNYGTFPALYAAETKTLNKLVVTPYYHSRSSTALRRALHVPYTRYAKRIFERADRIICVSAYEKNLLTDRHKIDERKITVIPIGINIDEISALKIGVVPRVRRSILYVGRLEKYKGVDYAVQALPYLDDDITLEIVGNGPYEKTLRKLVSKMGLQGRVTFYGGGLPRSEISMKYIQAGLVVLLSKYESFGIVVGEALAAGTPCIVSTGSALDEWVDNRTCFGVNFPIDINGLANLILGILGTRVQRISLPSYGETVRRLMSLYEQILD